MDVSGASSQITIPRFLLAPALTYPALIQDRLALPLEVETTLIETERTYHELANIFPLMQGAEFESLKNDIAKNGQLESIWLHPDGRIIDGRNRHRACRELGIAPEFRTWEGTDPTAFVVSLNLYRRHLSESQRGMVAAKLANMNHGGDRKSGEIKGSIDLLIPQADAATLLNVSVPTIKRAKSVMEHGTAELIESVEQGDIPVSAAAKIAKLTEDEQTEALGMIDSGEVKYADQAVGKIKRRNKAETIAANNQPIENSLGTFNVLYADPPWRYEHSVTDSRQIENQYPTMSLDDICALPIGEITEPDAVLLLWATSPKLAEAMQVIDAWGFTYRSCMVWDKERMGMGYYARQQHELLLIAARGNLPVPEAANRPRSVIRIERDEKHSAKPHEFYQIIERMYPEYRKVELFARERRPDWAAWGNQS